MSDDLTGEEYWNPQALLAALAARGSQPALVQITAGTCKSVSCADLARDALCLARGLVTAGVAPREPVALVAPNGPEWVAVRLGIAASGAMAVPLDDQVTASDLRARIAQVECRFVFASPAHLAALTTGSTGRLFVLDDGAGEQPAPSWRTLLADESRDLPPIEPEQPALIVFTSGTTGTPKRFTLSYANIGANVAALAAERLAGPHDRFLLPLPLDNIYPYVVGLLTPLAIGARCVFPEALTGPLIAQALSVSGATVMIGVPRLYEAVVAGIEARVAARGWLAARAFHALLGLSIRIYRGFGCHAGRLLFRGLHARFGPELRLLLSGGARLTGALGWRLEGLGWEVLGGYGLAEVGSIFARNRPDWKRVGSQGRPLPGRQLRIDRPDADGTGEIQLRGPSVFAGYLDDPAANRDAFTDDGWFRTGDLGRLDAEGFLHVTGRSKEVIVLAGGRNIYPEQVEPAYGKSPYVEEVAVLERDGRLVALVRPDQAAILESGNARVEDVIRVALTTTGGGLPTFQRLSGFALVRQPLPRNRLGKYQRFRLPELYEAARRGRGVRTPAALSPADAALWGQALSRRILDWLKLRYPGKILDPDASLQLDIGIDSLEWVSLTLELERRIGVALSDDQIARIVTLRDLLEHSGQAAREPGPPAPADASLDDAAWTRPRGPLLTAIATVLLAVNRFLVKRLFRLRVVGQAAAVSDSGCVFVANHASDLDPLVLAAALSPAAARRLRWGGVSSRLFTNALKRLFCRVLGVFPVDERTPAKSLALARAVLERGDSLAWFPESWRSPDGQVQGFLPGIGWLLERSGAVAVPLYIDGTFEAMPRWRRWPKPAPVTVVFGRPWRAEAPDSPSDTGDRSQRIADELRAQVIALRPPRDPSSAA